MAKVKNLKKLEKVLSMEWVEATLAEVSASEAATISTSGGKFNTYRMAAILKEKERRANEGWNGE